MLYWQKPNRRVTMLPPDVFIEVVKYTPLVSIDLILYNPSGEVLVGMRANRPAQHCWFVPGGRINKDETVEAAFQRIAQMEFASAAFEYRAAQFRGVFQHVYADNFLGKPGFGTHYIVLAYEIRLGEHVDLSPGDRQHHMYRWMPIPTLLEDAAVHPNTKYYFLSHDQPVGVFPLYDLPEISTRTS
jgi:colanic acid biosynthesis protein WcaH